MSDTTALAPTQKRKLARIRRPLPNTADVLAVAELLYKGGLTSKTVTKPEHLATKIIAGMEIGFSPVQACNNIMLVNGRATIYGDGALALVRESGLLVSIDEFIEGEGEHAAAVCRVHRTTNVEPKEFRFSVADAKTAKLWGNVGPWTQYPTRMLAMRARAFALRDVFTDVLCGLGIFEELRDAGTVVDGVRVTAVATSPPAAATEKNDSAGEPLQLTPIIDDDFWRRMGVAKEAWLKTLDIDTSDGDLCKREWVGKLAHYKVASAKELDPQTAFNLLMELEEAGKVPNPF